MGKILYLFQANLRKRQTKKIRVVGDDVVDINLMRSYIRIQTECQYQ